MSAYDAVALLLTARQGGPRPATLPPQIRDADWAYRVQSLMVASLGGRIGGWKAGLSASEPPSRAPLPLEGMRWSPTTVPLAQMPFAGVEAEIAFQLGTDLPPRGIPYSREAVADALSAAAPAIELVDTRFADFDAARPVDRLADLGSHFGLVVGTPVTDWQRLPLDALPLRFCVGERVLVEQTGGHSAGHPLEAVVWLANHLHAYGDWLRAGQWVTTGAIGGLQRAPEGGTVVATFTGFGEVMVTLMA
ncbi:MAG: 2-keto-4-pentenoate hydratase [Alphaproteobacteria bacterium]|nr:MAG: 2-keto-4-pentenoate hydratase [Alphaproteobacteria bacterium]